MIREKLNELHINALFGDNIVLTSNDPFVMLNFSYISKEYKVFLYVDESTSSYSKYLFINGIRADKINRENCELLLDSAHNNACFCVNTFDKFPFQIKINIELTDIADNSNIIVLDEQINIFNRPYIINADDLNLFGNQRIINEQTSSFMCLRTTPWLTGNIKIVVDSKNDIYLDTFPVSNILSNKLYRKNKVSSNAILSNDIYNYFKTLPKGDMYKINNYDELDISIPKQNINQQFSDIYNYGARISKNNLYPEKFSILAPLWVNQNVPDCFVIFKLKGAYNQETYELSEINLYEKFLKESTIVKVFDLRGEKTLGQYLRTHVKERGEKINSAYISYNDNDYNTWYGISLDSGVICGKSETTYNFKKQKNSAELNDFVTKGYYRNNMVSANLFNIEFLFDDDEAENFEMNRYFGLYMNMNQLYQTYFYNDNFGSSQVFIEGVYDDNTNNIINNFTDKRIFLQESYKGFRRLFNSDEMTPSSQDYNKVKNNFYSFKSDILTGLHKNFLSLQINHLNVGDHLRLILNKDIYEIYIVDDEYIKDQIWPYPSKHEIDELNIYRVCVNVKDDNYKLLSEAFNLISNNNFIAEYNNNFLFIHSDNEFKIQYILAPNNEEVKINYMGIFNISYNDMDILKSDQVYDFELYGDRFYYEFQSLKNNSYLYTASKDLIPFLTPRKIIMYPSQDNYYKINNFTFEGVNINYIPSPFNEDEIIISTPTLISFYNNLVSLYDINPVKVYLMGIFNVKDIDNIIYDSKTILNGQQMNFYSEYFNTNSKDSYTMEITQGKSVNLPSNSCFKIISGEGWVNGINIVENNIKGFNTYFGEVVIQAKTNISLSYIDEILPLSNEKENISEDNLRWYLDENSTFLSLKYNILTPDVIKWVSIGKDVNGNNLQLVSPSFAELFIDTSVYNFIASYDNDESVTTPSFKYLNPSKNYIYYDFNDVFLNNGVYSSFKDLILNNTEKDFITKLVQYKPSNFDFISDITSLISYNSFRDVLECIVGGCMMQLSKTIYFDNYNLNLKNYDNYKVYFVSTSTYNFTSNHPIEIIINENYKNILIIWYQGKNCLCKETLNQITYSNTLSPLDEYLGSGLNGLKYTYFDNLLQIKYHYIIRSQKTMEKLPYFLFSSDKNMIENNFVQFNTNYFTQSNNVYCAYNYCNINQNNVFNDNNEQYDNINGVIDYNNYPITYNYRNVNSYSFAFTQKDNYQDNLLKYNKSNTLNFKVLTDILNLPGSIATYIISGKDYLYSSDESPLNITLQNNINKIKTESGKDIYTYSFYYNPKFIDIFEFSYNEDNSLVKEFQTNFTLANTNLINVKKLNQYWYNVVSDDVNFTKIEKITDNVLNLNIDYKTLDIFSSMWDKNFFTNYTLSNNQIVRTPINGYLSDTEQASFFGSKITKLPSEILLSGWDPNNITIDENNDEYIIQYNISKTLLNLVLNNEIFIKNWVEYASNQNIINYIYKNIIEYYLINNNSKVILYYSDFNGNIVEYQNTDGRFFNEMKNFKSELTLNNGDYVYNIIINKTKSLTYYLNVLIKK